MIRFLGTLFVVTYKDDMCFAFYSRGEAEDYIRIASQASPGTYNRDNLRIKIVDLAAGRID